MPRNDVSFVNGEFTFFSKLKGQMIVTCCVVIKRTIGVVPVGLRIIKIRINFFFAEN